MKNAIIGTAGHIDHGKTTLIKALTGVDTDRLAEEKRRGISIDLGFARLKLPNGTTVGVVDVPGHERFVKNMLAGATGIDILLLVIAADDGVMPQTKEHLLIADILKVKRAVVALTKADLVDSAWLKIVMEDISALLKETAYAEAAIIPVSPVTGLGLSELKVELERALSQIEERDSSGLPRLPIDRVFTVKGAGTVVTGTLWSGRIALEDQLRLFPLGLSVRVRGLNVHDSPVKEALAGQRVAVNLAGVDIDQLSRGDTLAAPDYLKETLLFDGKFYLLNGVIKPIKTGTRVRLHHGTKEVLARIRLLSGTELSLGASGFVRFELESPLVLKGGDRYIVRRYSPAITIGGGSVLDAHPKIKRGAKELILSRLAVIDSGDLRAAVSLTLSLAKAPLTRLQIASELDIDPSGPGSPYLSLFEGGSAAVRAIGEKGELLYMASSLFDEVREKVATSLAAFHQKNPLSEGIKKEVLRAEAMPAFDQKRADAFLASLKEEGLIDLLGDLVSRAGFVSASNSSGGGRANEVLGLIEGGAFSPPTLAELKELSGLAEAELKEYLRILTLSGKLARIKHDLFYEMGALTRIEATLVAHLKEHGRINPADFRELFGVSRKYILPLLEYFDAKKITRRVDGDRVLR